jgi:hypothetical protein
MDDALKLGTPGDWFHPTLTAEQAGRLARAFNMLLPTPRIADLTWASGSQAAPVLGLQGPGMASVATMLKASNLRRERSPGPGLKGQAGKYWVNTPQLWRKKDGKIVGLNRGANYGFYTHPEAPPVPRGQPGPKPAANAFAGTLWQQVGLAHSFDEFTDYSQTFRALSRFALLHRPGGLGEVVDVAEIALDPDLFELVSAAPVRMHHPGQAPPEPCATQFVDGACLPTLPPEPKGGAEAKKKTDRSASPWPCWPPSGWPRWRAAKRYD